ncbi:unnamed protein product [Rhizopus stolonifer]
MSNIYTETSANQDFLKRPMVEQTLRSVTIKQMKDANVAKSGSACEIDKADCDQVTFVGIIRGIQEYAGFVDYLIEDGTSAISITKWIEIIETEEEANARRLLAPEIYVHVCGRMRSFNEHIRVTAFNIRPIVDFNEITHHFLDAINSHLMFSKPNKEEYKIDAEDHILFLLKNNNQIDEGVSIYYIIEHLKPLCPENELRNATERIKEKGLCLTTFDSNHFKFAQN